MESSKPLVTIFGITGFLGSHTCLTFLKDGGYRVRGTLRDKTKEEKVKPVREAFGEYWSQLEVVECDLYDLESIDKAVEGSTYVVHTASVIYFEGKNPQRMYDQEIKSTQAMMESCVKHKVKRFIRTSTTGAIGFH